MEIMDSPLLIQIRGKMKCAREALRRADASKDPILPEDDSSMHDGILIAWTMRADFEGYKRSLVKYMEKLQGEEADEMRCLQRIWTDQQHQLAMARQNQDQGQDGIHARLDRLERASSSQLPAPLASEKILTTVKAKADGLPSQRSTTVTGTDMSTVPGLTVNETLMSPPSSSLQPPQMLEQEVTSYELKLIQRKAEIVRDSLHSVSTIRQYPRIEQLSKEAIDDPEILILWSQNTDFYAYRKELRELLKTLLKKEEAERKYLRGLAVAV